MKVITCSQIGGPESCTDQFKAATSEEMIRQGWKHIEEAHPELADNIKNNPKEINDKWMADFHAKFDSLPEAEI
jgi:predicted small metal-binding protein